MSPSISSNSAFNSSSAHVGLVSPPPQASINPSPLSRRRSDYVDQSQEALSGLIHRPPIDYPDLSSHHVLRPPPTAATSSLERQDNRPRVLAQTQASAVLTGPRPPTIPSDYPVHYWPDVSIATSGLKNMGNTCYMNATIQCLNATVPFTRFFIGEPSYFIEREC
jgi:ubiquitin carboxyl-terminal hydrolase 8